MGTYVALARKWRSSQFSDIVGQTAVVRTLMNSIRQDRVHHAYLFTGSRGIGKTSIARIFSKALRCENLRDENDWLSTCDQCSHCSEVQTGSSVDVIEIDGASNNGVDAVREIRENAKFLPSSGRRKIYIIDEVHMLTTAAFNALLKTLEEPPEHVVFILATTEAHKIPSTILSRVQRFDLKRMTPDQIQDRLALIIEKENLSAEPSALSLIARAAEGSMRDSLSILDQVIAYSGGAVTPQAVRESAGMVDSTSIATTLRGIAKRDPASAIEPIREAYRNGYELKNYCRGLLEGLYAVLVLKSGGAEATLAQFVSEEELHLYREISREREIEEFELFFQVFHHGFEALSKSPVPRIWLETLVMKCASAETLVPLAPVPPTNPSGRASSTPHAGSSNSGGPATRGGSSATQPQASAPPPPQAKGSLLFGATSAMNARFGGTAAVAAVTQEEKWELYVGPKNWESFVEFVRAKRPLLGSVLEHASCEKFPANEGDDFLICFSEKEAHYFREQIQMRSYQDQLQHITRSFFGRSLRILTDVRSNVSSLAEKKEQLRAEWEKKTRERAESHPILVEARSLFGGTLGAIELLAPKNAARTSEGRAE